MQLPCNVHSVVSALLKSCSRHTQCRSKKCASCSSRRIVKPRVNKQVYIICPYFEICLSICAILQRVFFFGHFYYYDERSF